MNNLSLVNIFGETGRFFYNINYMLNSEHLSLVNKIGDKTEFTITRVHCNVLQCKYVCYYVSEDASIDRKEGKKVLFTEK